MGREIRHVPPDWEHPRDHRGHYQPMLDRVYEDAAEDWLRQCHLWEAGEHPDQDTATEERPRYYWQWAGDPPDPAYYRHRRWTPEEATALQVYETVTEGTPASPVFTSREALIEWLVEGGDDWNRQRGEPGWTRENAEAFVHRGWAPTLVIQIPARTP